jgi:Ca2+/H+ antiporter, TMEM165/GDT1 family
MSGGLVALATFLAASVEWVEALTIVLAVGMFKSWRTALLGTAAGLATLVVLVILFGFTVTSYVSLSLGRTLVGTGLLLFGLGWLYKAIMRSTGLKAQHDEGAAFEEAREELMTHGHAFGTAFGGVFLEGLEVVFIVVALGGLNFLTQAMAGAIVALVVVVVAGVVVRHPLTRVPENTVKYAVGVMLTSFGTFFAGEGLGVRWWNSDIALLFLIGGYAVASLMFVQYLRQKSSVPVDQIVPVRMVRAAVLEVWGLFVTDGLLASVSVAALLFVVVFIDKFGGDRTNAGLVLVAGVLLALGVALLRVGRGKPGTGVTLKPALKSKAPDQIVDGIAAASDL